MIIKSIPFSTLLICFALFSEKASAGLITPADFDTLAGKATENVVVAVTDNGVTADLTFTFTALAPGHTGSPTLAFGENSRLGINSSFNSGATPDTSVNEGETIRLDVSAAVTSAPPGGTVTELNFGIPKIEMVRNGSGSPRVARYLWSSSAGSFTSNFDSVAGAQPQETMDGSSVFNIVANTYTGFFNVERGSGVTTHNGFRWVTSSNNIDFTFAAVVVPEPTTTLGLLGLLASAFVRRKRRRLV